MTGHCSSLAIGRSPSHSHGKRATNFASLGDSAQLQAGPMRLWDKIAITLFSAYSAGRGFSFGEALTVEAKAGAQVLFWQEGYKLPEQLDREVEEYRKDNITFVAYLKNKPVGTISLADPLKRNRPFEQHGLDEHGMHYEIRQLVVSKEIRQHSMLVLMGLFVQMHRYSLTHGINSWISLGLRQLYVRLQRYSKNINFIGLGENFCHTPLARYLYEHNIFDTCAVMKVHEFSIGRILIKFLRLELKK